MQESVLHNFAFQNFAAILVHADFCWFFFFGLYANKLTFSWRALKIIVNTSKLFCSFCWPCGDSFGEIFNSSVCGTIILEIRGLVQS